MRQVELMRQLVTRHGRKPEIVCTLYAQAERDGIVQRKSNLHRIDADEYARRLYRDGELKGWLSRYHS